MFNWSLIIKFELNYTQYNWNCELINKIYEKIWQNSKFEEKSAKTSFKNLL